MSEDVRGAARTAEDRARDRLTTLWQPGMLFHLFSRYPRRPGAARIDRLAAVLKRGLIPPALDAQGTVISDWRLQVTGSSRPYDSFVFLHEFGDDSILYLPQSSDTICCFVDRSAPIVRPEALLPDWDMLCRDEVYADSIISPQQLIGIAVDPEVVQAVYEELATEFHRLALPLYDFSGSVYWPPR
jgi:hypothetical protein